MAKRTTRNSPTTTPAASAPVSMPGAQPEMPVEQAVKAAGHQMSPAPQREDVRASVDMAGVTHDMIAERAYHIWRAQGGSDLENWLRAEQELRTHGTRPKQWH